MRCSYVWTINWNDFVCSNHWLIFFRFPFVSRVRFWNEIFVADTCIRISFFFFVRPHPRPVDWPRLAASDWFSDQLQNQFVSLVSRLSKASNISVTFGACCFSIEIVPLIVRRWSIGRHLLHYFKRSAVGGWRGMGDRRRQACKRVCVFFCFINFDYVSTCCNKTGETTATDDNPSQSFMSLIVDSHCLFLHLDLFQHTKRSPSNPIVGSVFVFSVVWTVKSTVSIDLLISQFDNQIDWFWTVDLLHTPFFPTFARRFFSFSNLKCVCVLGLSCLLQFEFVPALCVHSCAWVVLARC